MKLSQRLAISYIRTKFKLLSAISKKKAAEKAFQLFCTPQRRNVKPIPKIFEQAEKLHFKLNGHTVNGWRWNHPAERRVLILHGYESSVTNFDRYIRPLLKKGYEVLAFDAPAHGKSSGRTTLMPEFIASILEIDKQFGPFDAAIGHSLGGMSLLNAIVSGFKINRLVIIGSGDIIQDIIDDFVLQLELDPKFNDLLRIHFENKHNALMDNFSAWHSAQKTQISTLVVHDQNDAEVPVKCAYHIHENLKNSELMITKNLGHRKILGDKNVIAKTVDFIKKKKI